MSVRLFLEFCSKKKIMQLNFYKNLLQNKQLKAILFQKKKKTLK